MNCKFIYIGPAGGGKNLMKCQNCGRQMRSKYLDPKLVHAVCRLPPRIAPKTGGG